MAEESRLSIRSIVQEQFTEVTWRLELVVGSRAEGEVSPEPHYVLFIHTLTAGDPTPRVHSLECSYSSLLHIVGDLEAAQASLRGSTYRRIHRLVK
jgi:hypothetical protein